MSEIFDCGAPVGMTTTHGAPTCAAAHATAPAWLPAETVINPRPRSSPVRVKTLLSAPRALNEPVF